MKIGFIGTGNMGMAILRGIIDSHGAVPQDILVYDVSGEARDRAKALGVDIRTGNQDVARQCGTIFLAVKPQYYPAVIEEIRGVIQDSTVIVTIAPGFPLNKTAALFNRPVKLIRTMPNTPAMVGEGMTAACRNDLVTEAELACVCRLFNCFGKYEVIPEPLMEAVIGVSGSSPAYVYLFIEALADGAVREGMPRQQAYRFAAQAVLGSAKMVLETGLHPGALKDMVCSPGGTTIEAVSVLEEKGFRSAVLQAMKACVDKSKNM